MGSPDKYKYFLLYKPFGFLSQFTKEIPEHQCLSDLKLDIPKDCFPVGRLDKDSEGLLLLSNHGKLNNLLLDPKHEQSKTYYAQVEGAITMEAVQQLKKGVKIKLKTGTYQTKPCQANLLTTEPNLPERNPPIRYRKSIPTSWVSIQITEGKNRQVRKMCAAVGFPVLRLVRVAIKDLKASNLQPGELLSLSKTKIEEKLGLKLN
ncbi:MAG: pseudouridine synthase [Saprospiraceae bacterium]|nr:pseudouridine synthase [Saprospiraceae bacterium]